jgi:glycosyltransferase involved in cell wall biosynthesis
MKREAETILKKKKINYKEIKSDPSKFEILNDLKNIIKIYFTLKKHSPDIIHIASPKSLILGGLAARIFNKAGIVLSISGLGYLFTENNLKTKFLSNLFIIILKFIIKKKESILIVQNKDDYKLFYKNLRINKEKIKLIKGSGVNINKFYPPKDRKENYILFPGRLLLNKGILEYYESAKIVNRKFKNWKFLIAGASDYKSPVLIKKNKLKEILSKKFIKYLGHVDYQEMPELFSKVSIICLPSYREGMPMVLQEGASSGIPIITTNETGCKEVIINNRTGFLVEKGSVNRLAKKLIELISNVSLRKKFGKNARKFAIKNFNESLIVNQNINIYKKLIKYGKQK